MGPCHHSKNQAKRGGMQYDWLHLPLASARHGGLIIDIHRVGRNRWDLVGRSQT